MSKHEGSWMEGYETAVFELNGEIAILQEELATLMQRYDGIVVEKAELQRERTQAVNDLAAANASADKYMHKHDKALEALDEARTALSWMLHEGMDEVIPETCPVEYKRCVEAVSRIDAFLKGIENETP